MGSIFKWIGWEQSRTIGVGSMTAYSEHIPGQDSGTADPRLGPFAGSAQLRLIEALIMGYLTQGWTRVLGVSQAACM